MAGALSCCIVPVYSLRLVNQMVEANATPEDPLEVRMESVVLTNLFYPGHLVIRSVLILDFSAGNLASRGFCFSRIH